MGVAKLLEDSEQRVSEIDALSIAIGAALPG